MPFYQYETKDRKVVLMRQGSITEEQPVSIIVRGEELSKTAEIEDGKHIVKDADYHLYRNKFPGGSFKLAPGFNKY